MNLAISEPMSSFCETGCQEFLPGGILFAAALAATRQPHFMCNYMSLIPAAGTRLGSMRIFALSPGNPSRGSATKPPSCAL